MYISNLTEKLVAKQLIEYVSSNGLDDILVDIDNNNTVIL